MARMELTDQPKALRVKHPSDSTHSEQEVIRYEKIAKRIADMHSALSEKMGALDEKMDNYYSEYKKSVKRLERDMRSIETELKVLDDLDYVGRDTVANLIEETIPLLVRNKSLIKNNPFSSSSGTDPHADVKYIREKILKELKSSSYSSESSDESDSVIMEGSWNVPHKQRRKKWPGKVKWVVV